MRSQTDLSVILTPGGDAAEAEALAGKLGVSLAIGEVADVLPEGGVALVFCADGVVLTDGSMNIAGDFSKLAPRCTPSNLSSEMLVRAVKIKGLDRPAEVIDATAGLGEDSFLLAAAGCRVRMFEYDPVISALLSDALRRAKNDPGLSAIASRMELVCADSTEALPEISPAPDVVLLDPMFPERQKSGLVKKKFQLIHRIEAPCDAEEKLLLAAKAAHPRKIVIKRPAKGGLLANAKPSYSLSGKAIRYDVLVL